MLFNYKATSKEGSEQNGSIDAPTIDIAISSLQHRGLIVISVTPVGTKTFWNQSISFFNGVKMKDVVILSRQIATLFEAKVSVLAAFQMLAGDSQNEVLRQAMLEATDDIKGGIRISEALAKHPKVFSQFYVDMVRSGEESGKLSETFNYLADYLDRTYELNSKARNALVYPAFVIFSFLVVVIIMMTFVIPKLSSLLVDSGQAIPLYTQVIIATSNFFLHYGLLLFVVLVLVGVFLSRYIPTSSGSLALSRFKINVPYIGDLYRKLYLARIADNMNTMLTSGISMVRALDITADVVDNAVYHDILKEASEAIKGGGLISTVFAEYEEIPSVMIGMMRVGEETGKLGFVLQTLARFYQREVNTAVDTLVGLIEPAMIILLGVAVGVLLTAVLVPIYNIAAAI